MKKGSRVRFWVNTYEPEFGTIMRLETRYNDLYAKIKPDARMTPVYLFRHGSAWRFEPITLLGQ